MSHLEERKRPINDYLNRENTTTTELSDLASKTTAYYTKGFPHFTQLSTPILPTASPNPK